ncbi:MAG: hypothetical protein ABIO70_14980 [Pseudomonadota bacterium]
MAFVTIADSSDAIDGGGLYIAIDPTCDVSLTDSIVGFGERGAQVYVGGLGAGSPCIDAGDPPLLGCWIAPGHGGLPRAWGVVVRKLWPYLGQALCLAGALAWLALYVLPDWRDDAVWAGQGESRLAEQREFEARYTAGWLTRTLRERGELPSPLPANPAAGGGNTVVEGCVLSTGRPQSCGPAWLLCREERKVRALACPPQQVIEDGGWWYALWPLAEPSPYAPGERERLPWCQHRGPTAP